MATRVHDRSGEDSWRADVSGATVTLDSGSVFTLRDLADGHWQIEDAAGAPQVACAVAQGDVVWVWLEGELFELRTDLSGDRSAARGREGLSAPMPATVVRIAVAPGSRVSRGETLVVLEAMKMELPIRAPQDGTVSAVHCREGELVQPGVVLIDLT